MVFCYWTNILIFYTYLWLREDGTPYYVGKGSGRRAFISNSHRMKRPLTDDRILIQEFPNEATSFEAERFLIAFYGRKDLGTGCLRNMTDGGEGNAGPSIETRRKIGESQRGNKYNLGRVWSIESRQKISKANLGRNRGRVHSPESRRRMSESKIGNKHFLGHTHSLATRLKIRESHLGRVPSSATRLKMSKAQKQRYSVVKL